MLEVTTMEIWTVPKMMESVTLMAGMEIVSGMFLLCMPSSFRFTIRCFPHVIDILAQTKGNTTYLWSCQHCTRQKSQKELETFASDPIGKCSQYGNSYHSSDRPPKCISFRPASSSGQRRASRHRNKMVVIIWGDRILPGLFSGDPPFSQIFFWFIDNQRFLE